jgi:FtsZ-interacting cell division protein ZipA
MSTGLIVAIVVVAIILIALLVMVPRARARATEKRREHELRRRRRAAAGERRDEAETRVERAARAEQRARIAGQEARRERAEAELQQERAAAYERGMADEDLVGEEADRRFARRGDSSATTGDGREERRTRTSAYQEGHRAAGEPQRAEDFREGRADAAERGDGNGGLLGRFRRRSSQREPAQRR